MRQNLQKWGNSSGIRLPKQVIEAANLKPNQSLTISVKGKSIVLTPVDEPDLSLDGLLKAITPQNLQGPVDWGEPVGKEAW